MAPDGSLAAEGIKTVLAHGEGVEDVDATGASVMGRGLETKVAPIAAGWDNFFER